jgi:hypothetical protein
MRRRRGEVPWRTVLRARRGDGYVLTMTDGRAWVTLRTAHDRAEAEEEPAAAERVASADARAAGRAHRRMAGTLLAPPPP